MRADIIKVEGELPSQQVVAEELDRLEAAGDTSTLNEVAHQAAAHQAYAQRAEALERANYFGRVKVMAEARIGSIDLDLHPRRGNSSLIFGNGDIPERLRSQWRTLGAGFRAGQLDKALSLVEVEHDVTGTSAVVRALHKMGSFYVSTAPLLKRYHELYLRDGLTLAEVERQAGFNVKNHLCRPGTKPRADRSLRHMAERTAIVLGVDISELQSVPKRPRNQPRARLRRACKLRGGRLDETYVLIRKALQELDSAVGTSGKWGTEEAYVHLYEAEGIIGKALRYAV